MTRLEIEGCTLCTLCAFHEFVFTFPTDVVFSNVSLVACDSSVVSVLQHIHIYGCESIFSPLGLEQGIVKHGKTWYENTANKKR